MIQIDQHPQTIDTIRNGYETLTRSNAKYSRHRVTMLVLPMDKSSHRHWAR